ncbi:hypothetical protein K435DRAFT_278794 [Dendrothele bispora CBS 962.96]|uniref:Uncharacterized protein n=1 Tax=Dendrothele bispora (strain CBS 962.96) TaxID=1314807 RepID=A0A4S8ML78_DENBC|nr:hypothetical protein K435DRAFT_278794 [Dendrothele bispora CBS 962.96]
MSCFQPHFISSSSQNDSSSSLSTSPCSSSLSTSTRSSESSNFTSPLSSPLSHSSCSSSPSLAWKLRRFDYLLDALQELGDFFVLSDTEFTHSGSEIVRLFEIARDTLEKAGIILRTYTHCAAHLMPYKRAYFNLLNLLRNRDHCMIDRNTRARWLRLVFRLNRDFTIDISPSHQGFNYLPSVKRDAITASSSINSSSIPPDFYKSMPPPDAYPPSQGVTSLSCLRLRRGKPLDLVPLFSWDSDVPDIVDITTTSSGSGHCPPPRLRRGPMTGRFGIFCTSKTSMHQTKDYSISSRSFSPAPSPSLSNSLGRGRTISRRPSLIRRISDGY